jgi:hypothetical protein
MASVGVRSSFKKPATDSAGGREYLARINVVLKYLKLTKRFDRFIVTGGHDSPSSQRKPEKLPLRVVSRFDRPEYPFQ